VFSFRDKLKRPPAKQLLDHKFVTPPFEPEEEENEEEAEKTKGEEESEEEPATPS
jgi:hypothetical protein